MPRQEVACFALVFADRGEGLGYAGDVARAFIEGYRKAGGTFGVSDADDLAMLVQGRLWWTEQNVRMALGADASPRQDRLAATLLRGLEGLPPRLPDMWAVLAGCG